MHQIKLQSVEIFHLKEKNVNLFVVPKERPGGYQDQ